MSKNLFITATGTDVGKTYISALIVKKMREFGYNCGYFKPVMSGVVEKDGKLIESDCNYVVKTANIPVEAENCVTYWWKEAVSPHLASQRAGMEIELQKILNDFKRKTRQYDYLLIEGAGGITCPLKLQNGEKYLLSDLISELKTPIVVVADGGLGTINSTLLTVEYARANNIKVNGIIFNNFNAASFMQNDNIIQTEYLTGVKVVAKVAKNATDIELLENLFE